ncbi:MAG: hypothetical protein M0R17_08150 [Candidatus Omnitrophica bacterium]|jgi:hypothetical protein|nr:hypothetical protein [Candidatus Omnitrophota bacterium]
MVGAYYDIEVFSNYVSFLFLDMTTKQEWIDMYIDADINKDVETKRYALTHMNYKCFILHKDQYDAVEFFEFMKDIKLLIGFNSIKFDDLLVMKMYIMKDVVLEPSTHWWAIERMKMLSDEIIGNKDINYKWIDEDLKKFKQWWTSIDLLMSLFETIARKSLKQAAINIKWYRIEDLPLKPDSNVNIDQFSKIFDYNMNDVLITRALHLKKKSEFELRINIGAKYGVNVLTSNRSTIADKLMGKFYSEYTGLKYFQFKDLRTYRSVINFGEILNPRINFITPSLKRAYEEIMNTDFHVDKKYLKKIIFHEKGYNIRTGGLHSIDRPGRFEVDATNKFLRDADVSSYYPSLVYNEGVCPAHLARLAFLSIVLMIKNDRLKYKDDAKLFKSLARYAEAKDAKTGADALKIVANSGLFGKMGYDGWLLDLKAMYQVTLNGQLYLMMLIEQLEESGIEVISANTDGIIAKFDKTKLQNYNDITTAWQAYTQLQLEFTDYIKYVRTSVNSYIAIKKEWLEHPEMEDVIKRKDEFITEVELSKGFNAPIVAIAIDKLIVNNIPIEQTIRNHTDIYDYCISVKTGDVYDKQLHTIQNGELDVMMLSKNLRYFVSNKGGTLLKHKTDNNNVDKYANMIKGVLITPFNDYFRVDNMNEYDINYQYYIKRATDLLLKIEGEYSKPRASRVFRGSKKKGVEQIGKLFDNI